MPPACGVFLQGARTARDTRSDTPGCTIEVGDSSPRGPLVKRLSTPVHEPFDSTERLSGATHDELTSGGGKRVVEVCDSTGFVVAGDGVEAAPSLLTLLEWSESLL